MVHTGAVVAANLSHGWRNCGVKHWKAFRNDTDKRNFVSGGCAAGVAAAFGAPIGGVLFSLEEASSFWSLDLTWKSFFCAIVSTFTINLCISTFRGNYGAINDPGLLSFGAFVDNPYTLWEIPIFMVMAVFGGVAGGVFNALNERLTKWRRDTMKGLKWQKNAEAMIIAFVTATVFFWLPQLFSGSCHSFPEGDFECAVEGTVDKHKAIAPHFDEKLYQAYTCPPGTYNDMASLSFTGQEKTIHAFFHNYHHEDVFVFTTTVCVTYFIVYYLLAVWTYLLQGTNFV
jgi:chloride channel 7